MITITLPKTTVVRRSVGWNGKTGRLSIDFKGFWHRWILGRIRPMIADLKKKIYNAISAKSGRSPGFNRLMDAIQSVDDILSKNHRQTIDACRLSLELSALFYLPLLQWHHNLKIRERERDREREKERERERVLGIKLPGVCPEGTCFRGCHTWLCFANDTCIPSNAAIRVY